MSDRRSFLKGAGLLGLSAGLSLADDLAAQGRRWMTRDSIDAHVHVWDLPNDRFPYGDHEGPAPLPSFSPEHMLEIARPAGVGRIVLIQIMYGTDNSYLVDVMKHHPSVFSAIAIVDPQSPSVGQEMSRLASLGVRGLRIMQDDSDGGWLEAPSMRALWRLAAETKLAICCLIQPTSFQALDRMCAEFPDTTVVIDHMGRIGLDGIIREEEIKALCHLAQYPRVYVKVSAFYALGRKQAPFSDLVPIAQALHGSFGPQRLMWGSDSPFQVKPPHTYRESLDFINHGLPFLTAEDRSWMLRRTAAKIFF
jgi:predicted TIM-barrel fold metal-dependent hydrolase